MEKIQAKEPRSQSISTVLLVAIISSVIVLGIIIALNNRIGLVAIIFLLSVGALLWFVANPRMLLYIFMLSFVLGETSIGKTFIQISSTNVLLLFAGVVILARLIAGRLQPSLWFSTPQKKVVFYSSILLLLFEIISATVNHAYEGVVMRISYILVVLMMFSFVDEKKVLYRGLVIGITSIALLSILTILRSLDLISIGYRANWNWNTAPWEAFLPRSIGLPGLDGGMHGIFIVSLLPLAFLMAVVGKKIDLSILSRSRFTAISLAGTAAIAISLYRSTWLGLITAVFTGLWAYYKDEVGRIQKIFFNILLVGVIITLLGIYRDELYDEIHRLFFEVRSQGVEARFIQYEFVLKKMTQPSVQLLSGYSYDRFGDDFLTSLPSEALEQNPVISPFLHNHFLWVLYAAGWPAFVIYIILLIRACHWLLILSRSKNPTIKIYSSGSLAGLIGILVIMNFTARYSGHFILWVLITAAAILSAPDVGRS